MQTPTRRPAHAFLHVCTNRRPPENSLGAGCGEHGEALYKALQQNVSQRGAYARVWLARSSCLGLCPRHGAAVALTPGGDLFTEASPADATGLINLAVAPRRP